MNFRQLDLNLLRVLAAIHRSGSVTAAGRALALSQPATSNALSRLRDHFRDDLFVRSPSGLKPTRLCERIAPEVQAQLQLLEATLTERDDFDPAHSEMRWRTSLSDLGEMMFLPPLALALRQQAPQAHLTNVSPRWSRARSISPSASCSRATAACAPTCCFVSTTWP